MTTLAKPKQKPMNLQVTNPPKPNSIIVRDSVWINKELQSMIEILQENQQIISKVQLFAPKSYTNSQFSVWRNKYQSIPSIQNKLKKIEEHLESHLITAGMTKNPAFPIFLLKNHYGYSDKREIAQDTTHTFIVKRGLPTDKGRKVIDLTPPNKM